MSGRFSLKGSKGQGVSLYLLGACLAAVAVAFVAVALRMSADDTPRGTAHQKELTPEDVAEQRERDHEANLEEETGLIGTCVAELAGIMDRMLMDDWSIIGSGIEGWKLETAFDHLETDYGLAARQGNSEALRYMRKQLEMECRKHV